MWRPGGPGTYPSPYNYHTVTSFPSFRPENRPQHSEILLLGGNTGSLAQDLVWMGLNECLGIRSCYQKSDCGPCLLNTLSSPTLWCAFKVSVIMCQPMTGRMGWECGPSSQPLSAECGQEEREGEGMGQNQPKMHLGEEQGRAV